MRERWNRGLLLALVLMGTTASAAHGGCLPGKMFSQWDPWHGVYAYVYMPAGATTSLAADPAAPTGGLVGRLWQAGDRALANEAGPACRVDAWLRPCGTGECYGSAWGYVNGVLNGSANGPPCLAFGCVEDAMIILIETTSVAGDRAYFATANAIETPPQALYYDYSSADGYLTEIPAPSLALIERHGRLLTFGVVFGDVGGGYFGSNGPAEGTITGFRLVRAVGRSDPGRAAGAWTFVQRADNTGGTVSLEGATIDCSAAIDGADIYLGTQLEFDHGQFLGDYVGASVRVDCSPAPRFRRVPAPHQGDVSARPIDIDAP